MAEMGYDISGNKTKSVFEILKSGKTYDYVITVCDPEAAEKCPVFPGKAKRLHWEFQDPSSFKGSEEEKLNFTRKVRDEIKQKSLSSSRELKLVRTLLKAHERRVIREKSLKCTHNHISM